MNNCEYDDEGQDDGDIIERYYEPLEDQEEDESGRNIFHIGHDFESEIADEILPNTDEGARLSYKFQRNITVDRNQERKKSDVDSRRRRSGSDYEKT